MRFARSSAGPDFADSEFNLATQGKRQPGSSFKTYVLTAAIERSGILPYDTISGIGPCTFDDGANGLYIVRNFGGGRGFPGTVTRATTSSSNCAFVRLGILTGLDEVADIASEMIGTNRIRPIPPVQVDVAWYPRGDAARACDRVCCDRQWRYPMEPYLIERVETRDGELLYQNVPRGRRIISEDTAAWVTNVLASNVRFGTATRAQLPSGQVVAGKTGTGAGLPGCMVRRFHAAAVDVGLDR